MENRKRHNKSKMGEAWDSLWLQDDALKQLAFLRNISWLYLSTSRIFSQFFNNYLKANKKYSILELGCAGSSYLSYLQKKYPNFKIFGIEQSFQGCLTTIFMLEKGLKNSNIICGDAFHAPIKPNSFDIVFSVGLIEHFEDSEPILKEHYKLLKPGGLLICAVPNVVGLQGKFFGLKIWDDPKSIVKDKKRWVWGMKKISCNELLFWFTNLGLKDIQVKPSGGIFPMLMMESYQPENVSFLVKLANFLYRYVFFLPLIAVNVPTLFRINTLQFSPFLIATGIK